MDPNDPYAKNLQALADTRKAQNDQQNQAMNDIYARQSADRNALIAGQNAQQQGLLKLYQDTSQGQQKLSDVYNNLAETSGLNKARQQYYGTQSLLTTLPQDVRARTAGSWTSAAQQNRQISAEQEPLSRNLALYNSILGQTSQDVSQRLQFAAADQQKELDPIKLRISAFSDQAARETTGFDKNKETELSLLLNKLGSERQLSSDEYNNMVNLAGQERQFANQKAIVAQQYQNSLGVNAQQFGYQKELAGQGFDYNKQLAQQGFGFNQQLAQQGFGFNQQLANSAQANALKVAGVQAGAPVAAARVEGQNQINLANRQRDINMQTYQYMKDHGLLPGGTPSANNSGANNTSGLDSFLQPQPTVSLGGK